MTDTQKSKELHICPHCDKGLTVKVEVWQGVFESVSLTRAKK